MGERNRRTLENFRRQREKGETSAMRQRICHNNNNINNNNVIIITIMQKRDEPGNEMYEIECAV